MLLRTAIVFGALTALAPSLTLGFDASAQSDVNLVTTNDPGRFVEDFLTDVREQGIQASAALFRDLGLDTPQITSAIMTVEAQEGDPESRWTTVIGSNEAGGALQQVYAYSYLGNNIWLFYRIDFVRISDAQWAVSEFSFNSEHPQIVDPSTLQLGAR